MSQQQAPGRSQQHRQSNPGGAAGGFATRQRPRQSLQQPQPVQQQSQPPRQQQQAGATAGPVGQQFSTRSYLPEGVRTTSIGLLNRCLADLVTVTIDTADFLNEVSRDVSEALWFVEAHLQGPRGAGSTGGRG